MLDFFLMIILFFIERNQRFTISCGLFVEASRGAGDKRVTANRMSSRSWVHFLDGVEAKRGVATLHAMPPEFDGNCLNTRLSLPTLTHAGYSV